jgi:CRP-like cAMP-binding protein
MRPRGAAAGTLLEPDRLQRLGFFREFTSPELRQLLSVGALQTYGAGEVLATEGTRKQRRVLYVAIRGELQYVKRVRGERAAVLLTLRPGDVGGFLTFFNDNPSPVGVRSIGRSAVFEIGRREFQGLLAEQPRLAAKVLLALARSLISRLEGLFGRVAAASVWALDLEQHVRMLPLRSED